MLKKLPIDDALFGLIYLLGMLDSLLIRMSTVSALPHADTLGTCLQLLALGLLALKLFTDRSYTIGTLFKMAAVGLLILITFWRSRYNHLFYFLFVFLGIRHVSLPRLIRLDFCARIAVYAFIVFLFAFDFIENYVTYRTGETTLRYSLGFSHPNTLASGALILVLTDAWLKRRTFHWTYAIVIWTICYVLYLLTSNRTSIIILVLFPLMLLAAKHIKIGRLTGFAFRWCLPGVIVLCYVFMLLCGVSPVAQMIDRYASNRFINCYQIYDNYGIALLGQKVTLSSVKAARLYQTPLALLDVAYLRMLLQGGPIILAFICLLYHKLISTLCRHHDLHTLMIVLAFIAYGVGESMFNNVYLNFTLVFAAKAFYLNEEAPDPLPGNTIETI